MANVIDKQIKHCFPEENHPSELAERTSEEYRKLCMKFDPPDSKVACSAQICPIFGNTGEWFPDEEICSHPSYKNGLCFRNQRKIARASNDSESYFTATMLNRDIIIKGGIRGLDPDHELKDREREERAWLEVHPVKRALSDEEREVIRKRFAKVQGKQPVQKTASDNAKSC